MGGEGGFSGCSLPKLWHFHYRRVCCVKNSKAKRVKKAQNNLKIFYINDKSKSNSVFNCN